MLIDSVDEPAEVSPDGSRCWCGEQRLELLRPDYSRCPSCGTVVYSEPYDSADYLGSEPSDFYGDRYWQRHVPECLGLPTLEERARSDLPERAVYHLTRILEQLAPGARLLELGCGAGCLTYLLRQAGFDASGLEMGPAAIELGRRRFGIEVVRGPLEARAPEARLDAIVAIDVVEHLPDPLATLRLCARYLGEAGLLFLQTPRYRGEGAGWEMLLPREHLFLFTAQSLERLLGEAGFAAVEVGDSLFPYDMWVVASRRPALAGRPEPLRGVPPVAVALIDAYGEIERARDERDAIDADRQLRTETIARLSRELDAVRADQQAKQALLHRQDETLAGLRADQQAKRALLHRQDETLAGLRADQHQKELLIGQLSRELAEVRRDQTAKAELIDRLAEDLDGVRRDQNAKEELIADLAGDLETLRSDHTARGDLIDRLTTELESVERDRSAKGDLIVRLSAELGEVRSDHRARGSAIDELDAELRSARAVLESIRSDRIYRLVESLRARLGRGRR